MQYFLHWGRAESNGPQGPASAHLGQRSWRETLSRAEDFGQMGLTEPPISSSAGTLKGSANRPTVYLVAEVLKHGAWQKPVMLLSAGNFRTPWT